MSTAAPSASPASGPVGDFWISTEPEIAPTDLLFQYWHGHEVWGNDTVEEGTKTDIRRTDYIGEQGVFVNAKKCDGTYQVKARQAALVVVKIASDGSCEAIVTGYRPLDYP